MSINVKGNFLSCKQIFFGAILRKRRATLMSKHNELGVKGEVVALEFLEKKGYDILEINWRFEKTEVDIIARDRNTLVIVEVKTRTSESFGMPEDSVNRLKQKTLPLRQKNIWSKRTSK